MDEYISRKDAIAKIREEGVYGSGYSNEEREDNVVDMLTSIPAADVRPVVRGKWFQNGYSIRCSECGYDMPFAVRNFCPNCGADMREGS